MGHAAGDDVAGEKSVKIFSFTGLLRFSAGEQKGTACVQGHLFDHKAGGAAYPGENGDVPHGACSRAVGTFLIGHVSGAAAQLEPQPVVMVKGERRAFQNSTAGCGGPQFLFAQVRGTAALPFGLVFHHDFHPHFIQYWCSGRTDPLFFKKYMRGRAGIFAKRAR